MNIPFPRFLQMLDVTRRRDAAEKKHQYKQSVFLAHWIYTAIPKSEEHKNLDINDFYEMYGLAEAKALEKIDTDEEFEAKRKEAFETAYRNVEKLGIPNPFNNPLSSR